MASHAIRRRAFVFKLIPKNSIGCEIGVWHGNFSNHLLRNTQPKMLHLIDPWIWTLGFKKEKFKGEKIINQEVMDKIYKHVCEKIGSRPNVQVYRATSHEAVQLFEDDYFDWVYVDGSHRFCIVYDDLFRYYKKLKSGGIIIGDDLNLKTTVKFAVDSFTEDMGIEYKSKGNQYWFWKE